MLCFIDSVYCVNAEVQINDTMFETIPITYQVKLDVCYKLVYITPNNQTLI